MAPRVVAEVVVADVAVVVDVAIVVVVAVTSPFEIFQRLI